MRTHVLATLLAGAISETSESIGTAAAEETPRLMASWPTVALACVALVVAFLVVRLYFKNILLVLSAAAATQAIAQFKFTLSIVAADFGFMRVGASEFSVGGNAAANVVLALGFALAHLAHVRLLSRHNVIIVALALLPAQLLVLRSDAAATASRNVLVMGGLTFFLFLVVILPVYGVIIRVANARFAVPPLLHASSRLAELLRRMLMHPLVRREVTSIRTMTFTERASPHLLGA